MGPRGWGLGAVCQKPAVAFWPNQTGQLLTRAEPVSALLVSLLEIPKPCPTPLRQTVGQGPSAGLPPLQQALPVKPQQVTVQRSAIGTRLEPRADLVGGEKTPGAIEYRQNFCFGHGLEGQSVKRAAMICGLRR